MTGLYAKTKVAQFSFSPNSSSTMTRNSLIHVVEHLPVVEARSERTAQLE